MLPVGAVKVAAVAVGFILGFHYKLTSYNLNKRQWVCYTLYDENIISCQRVTLDACVSSLRRAMQIYVVSFQC